MAKGFKTGGRDFEKGVKNHGRTRLPPELLRLKKISKEEIKKRLNLLLNMNKSEFKLYMEKPDIAVFDLLFGAIIKKTVETGDHTKLQWVFEFIYGKEVDIVETHNHNYQEFLETVPTASLLSVAK